MGKLSDSLKQGIVIKCLIGTVLNSTYYVALFNNGSELSGDGYARQSVSNSALFGNGVGNMVTSGGTVTLTNVNTITFSFTAAKEYDKVIIFSDQSSTSALAVVAEGSEFAGRTANEVRIDPGQISISLT